MSDLNPIFQILIEGLREIQLIKYTRASAAATVLFDYVITFDREVNLIWKRQWSWIKLLFFINRYYVLATSIFDIYAHFPLGLTDNLYVSKFNNVKLTVQTVECDVFPQNLAAYECSNGKVSPAWLAVSLLMVRFIRSCGPAIDFKLSTDIATLQFRIYALYSGSKRILAFMISTYILCVTASGYVVGKALVDGKAFVLNIPGGQFCDLRVIPQRIYAFWIPMLFFQTMLCTLAIIPAVRSFRSEGIIFNYRGKGLYNILIRDSTIYFAVIAFTYISCLTVWIVERKNGIIETPIGFAVAIQCSLCSRIILNLREADQLVVSEDSDGSQKPDVMLYGSGGYYQY